MNKNLTASFKLGASAVALMAVIGASGAAYAQDQDMETIVVTGYRASLEKAMDLKRNSLGATDSIMAEDIAKFPDMNVSESLQRIPGVAINRDAGEGRQITVRGLGPLFSRVRINGLEAMSTAGGSDASGGTNRGRSFDFNVFGSELFSGLTVNKSASASMEEGSLGATVDMRTARPFDYNRFVLSAAVQEGYNDFAGSANPKASVLVSDTFLGGRVGALFSAAYTVRHTLEAGASTVRISANGNSAVAVDTATPATTGIPVRPRMPRYELYRGAEKRLGLSSSLQWQAGENTLFTLSGLFSDFASQREETQLEMQTNSYGTLSAVSNQVYIPAGVCGGTTNCYWQPVLKSASGAKIRTEHRQDHLDTRFMQVTLEGSHSFSEKLKTNVRLGWSESHHRNPLQDYIMLDQFNVSGYGYDFQNNGNNWSPELNYGSANLDVAGLSSSAPSGGASTCTAGSNCWFVSSFRRRPQYNFNSFRAASWDMEFKPIREITITGGFDYKNYGFRTISYRLTTGEGTSTAASNQETFASAYGTSTSAAFYGAGGTAGTFANKVLTTKISDIAKMVNLPGYAPGVTPHSWLVADFDKAQQAWDYENLLKVGPGPDLGNNRSVQENDYAGWLQAGWDLEVLGMGFRGDVGARYVNTMVTALGYGLTSSGTFQPTLTTTGYHDFLPTLNMVVEPVENLLVRLNMAQVMSRPDLGSLAGDFISVSGSSHTINVANSNLKPFRANTIDLAFEWYYGKGAMLSVAGFYKKLGTFIATYRNTNVIPNGAGDAVFTLPSYVTGVSKTIGAAALQAACGATPNCATSPWSIGESINTPGGHIDGVEINWQQPFTFLPGMWSNFGVTANGTFVESNMCYIVGTACAYHPLTNQSRNSYNTTIYYDDTVFQARVSAAYRSHYFTALPGSYTDYEAGDDTFNLDASASYKFNEHFMVTFDALNLTDQHQRQYTGYYDSSNKYMYVNHRTGTDYYIGIKYDF
ncbi:TonB-dependent receptor [Rhizomicrobium electricum]|uniref:TonB-dependent receptor n=1 Tax=Rhizomicrobium electricum TaxID=480070 RepID=A0ABN1EHB2_9PROT|nr:TonB-dependent receptor [Rhizomicrobium electricum]NIJ48469.1 TonB-dependent receptor [Rhizomicrobium electricum]